MSSRYINCAVWWLRCALVVQCFGQASLHVFYAFKRSSPLYGLLVERFGVATDVARGADEFAHMAALGVAGVVLCLSLLLVVIGRSGTASWEYWPRTAWQLPLLVALAAWNIVLFGSDALVAGGAFKLAAIAAEAAPRLAVPLALCLLVFRKPETTPRDLAVRAAAGLLSLSMVAAFAIIGWRGAHFDPLMVDALLGTFHNVMRLPLGDDVAHYFVCAVGIVSAALAVFMLFFRWQGTAVAMAVIAGGWLLLGLGEGGLAWASYVYPDAAVQFATFAVPVAIVWLQTTPSLASDTAEDDALDDELVMVETA